MSENMNGMSAGNTADKTYANTKYNRVCWSCTMRYLMIV